ncbi:MAG: DUF2808 domain-containing protein [Cyanobacteria bacterium P01_D01_bin.14]
MSTQYQRFWQRWMLAAAATIAACAPVVPALAQSYNSDGLTLFGGVDTDLRLPYNLRNNERRNTRAQYALRVPGNKVQRATQRISIVYPEAFSNHSGRLDLESIEVRRGRGTNGEILAVDDVQEQEIVFQNRPATRLDIYLTEDIPSDTTFTVVLDDVRNPNRALMQRFWLGLQYTGDPVLAYVGAWELLIAYEDRD